jgi:hypothetical protein
MSTSMLTIALNFLKPANAAFIGTGGNRYDQRISRLRADCKLRETMATRRPTEVRTKCLPTRFCRNQATLSASAKLPPMILRISLSEKVPSSSAA